MKFALLFTALCATSGATFAFSGGTDSCTTPDPISGNGAFAYDNSAATAGVQGQTEALCNLFGTTNIDGDVWFAWTATSTGTATLSMCGNSGDSKIAVYPGNGCPVAGSALACNDDSCGLLSLVTFSATSGSTYTFQIGNYPGSAGVAGSFSVNVGFVPAPNDDCATPTAIAGTGTFPFDNTSASTGTQGQTEALCNFFGVTGIGRDVWYSWIAPASGTAALSLCSGTTMDSKVAVYVGSGCPASAAIACNDDSCGLRSSLTFACTVGQTYTLQLGNYPGTTPNAGTFDLVIFGSTFCEGTATTCPCGNSGVAGNGCANSVNPNGANLTSSGAALLASDTLVLQASGMPNGAIPPSFCVFVQGSAQTSGVFGDGLMCLASPMIRLGTRPVVGGASSFGHGVGADPDVSVQGLVGAPGARYYQVVYRNAANFCTSATFNTTNGIAIVWN